MSKRDLYIHVVILIILGFVIYSHSLNGKFLWDDYGLIKDNLSIRSWLNLPKIITEKFGSGGGVESNFYRPLQMFTHMIDYSLFGLKARGYHFVNIAWHILVTLCFYWFVHLISLDRKLAFIASLLFLTHPVHTEAVCYIAVRADFLSFSFILLSLIFYIKSKYPVNKISYGASLFCFVFPFFLKKTPLFCRFLL